MSSFTHRNLLYLRCSRKAVLQLILYVDPDDLSWFNSAADDQDFEEEEELDLADGQTRPIRTVGHQIVRRILAHLRYRVMAKLYREKKPNGTMASDGGKRITETYHDVDFSMAYFFRNLKGRHAVLIKDRQMRFPEVPREPMAPPMMAASAVRRQIHPHEVAAAAGEEGAAGPLPPSRLAERQNDATVLSRAREDETHSDIRVKEEEEETLEYDFDMDIDDPPEAPQEAAAADPEAIDLDAIEDEKKARMTVDYKSFRIFGATLVVVVEPSKRVKRRKPHLFKRDEVREKQQLSATPLPDQDRTTPMPDRIRSTPARNERADSLLSDAGPGADDRADSRRSVSGLARQGSARLFRGTPSDWEPTPSPAPEARPDAQRGASYDSLEDDEEEQPGDNSTTEDDEPMNMRSFALASQMLLADQTDMTERMTDGDDDPID